MGRNFVLQQLWEEETKCHLENFLWRPSQLKTYWALQKIPGEIVLWAQTITFHPFISAISLYLAVNIFFQSQPFAGRIFWLYLWWYLPCRLGQHLPPLASTFFTATEARVVVRTKTLSFHVPDHSGQRKHHGDHWPRWWLRRWSLRLCTWWQAGIWYDWPFSVFYGCTWRKSLIVLLIILFCSPCTFPFVRPFLGPQTLKKKVNLTCWLGEWSHL